MPDKHLPIYEIQDFDEAHQEQYFYLSGLRAHLQNHPFIERPHKHNCYILLFFTQGTGIHIIDFQEYKVKPGTIFFLRPGQVHSWQLSDETDGFILFFTPGYYLLSNAFKKLHQFPFFHGALRSPILNLPDAEFSPLLQTIAFMKAENEQHLVMKDDVLRNYLDILLIQLTRLYKLYYPKLSASGAILPQLQSFEALIEAHYKQHQPVSFYADKLHVTIKQLSDHSKRAYGKSTTDLIQDRTILEAKRLLVHSNLTINQIAAELGYFDNAYFFRFFKKHTGQTPEQFRKSHL